MIVKVTKMFLRSVFTALETTPTSMHPVFKVRVNDTWLDLLADSGSSINLLDCKSFNKLKPRPTLEPTDAKIYPYKSDDTLPILGKFTARVETTDTQTIEATF